MPYVILNHALIEAEKALISVQDRGFRFGDGLFETLRVENGVPYRFEWHMNRLAAGLKAIKLATHTDFNAECKQLLAANGQENCLLRIQVTRGIGSQGYLPIGNAPTIVIETLPLTTPPAAPVSLWLSSYEKISTEALPVQYKLAQGLNSTLARMEAAEHHCFEALLLSAQGEICEAGSGNIFWLKNGRLYTPALSCGILEGATRAAILQLSTYPIQEVAVKIEALEQAEAVCICNVAWGCLAVKELRPNTIEWQSTTLADALNAALTEDRAAYSKAHRHVWEMA